MTIATKGGAPRKFKTPEELEAKLDNYFESCFEIQWKDQVVRDKNGNKLRKDGKLLKKPAKVKIQTKPFTITGLALALDCSLDHLRTLNNGTNSVNEALSYPDNLEFTALVKRARLKCQNDLEVKALTNKVNAIFSIFSLKCNYDWQDKQVIETNITHNFNLRGLHEQAQELTSTSQVEVIEPAKGNKSQ